jgi:hypothetical protein
MVLRRRAAGPPDGRVLIAEDLPHPADLASEGRRVLFTFAGVGIAVVVMVLGNLLQKRTAKSAQPATASSRPGRVSSLGAGEPGARGGHEQACWTRAIRGVTDGGVADR